MEDLSKVVSLDREAWEHEVHSSSKDPWWLCTALENNVIDTRVCFPSSTRKKKKADIRQQASIKSISSSRAGVAKDWLLLVHTLVIIT